MSLSYQDWINFHSDKQITLKQFQEWKTNTLIDVCIFNSPWRIFNIDAHLYEGTSYKPDELFKYHHYQISKVSNTTWEIMFPNNINIVFPIHLEYAHFGEFRLRNQNNQFMFNNDFDDAFTTTLFFPETTKVGWRGPMMFWDDIIKSTQLIHLGNNDCKRKKNDEDHLEHNDCKRKKNDDQQVSSVKNDEYQTMLFQAKRYFENMESLMYYDEKHEFDEDTNHTQCDSE